MWDLYKLYEEEFKNTLRLRVYDDLLIASADKEPPCDIERDLLFAMIESRKLCSSYASKKRYVLAGYQNGNPMMREETRSDGWDHTPAPTQA